MSMSSSLPAPAGATSPADGVLAIDLQPCTDKAALMSCLAAALQLPAWFGGNWDALADVLADLSWLQPRPREIRLLHGAALAARLPAVHATLSWIVEDSNRLWADEELVIRLCDELGEEEEGDAGEDGAEGN